MAVVEAVEVEAAVVEGGGTVGVVEVEAAVVEGGGAMGGTRASGSIDLATATAPPPRSASTSFQKASPPTPSFSLVGA